jgi:shikimate-5-dehydrogenase/3-dehydroquinate dehydratase type I
MKAHVLLLSVISVAILDAFKCNFNQNSGTWRRTVPSLVNANQAEFGSALNRQCDTSVCKGSELGAIQRDIDLSAVTVGEQAPVIVIVQPKGDRQAEALVRHLSESLKYRLREVDSVQDVLIASSSDASQKNLLVSIKEEDVRGTVDLLNAFTMLNPIYLLGEGNDEGGGAARAACKYDLWTGSEYIKTLGRLDGLIRKLQGPPLTSQDTALDAGLWSHFISLTFPSIDEAAPILPDLRKGCDAFELRVDLLEDMSVKSIHRQIALLRDKCPLPIVYTVRSEGQIGKFPPDPERIFELLREGLRAGVEWVDVEACWPKSITHAFLEEAKGKYSQISRLLGSLHVTTPQSEDQIRGLFEDAALGGSADMLKVVTGAASEEDCRAVHSVGAAYARDVNRPYIGLCLGEAGQQSRVLNRVFTPVTHEMMATAAPGQLSAAQLMHRREKQGLCEGRKFYLFGTPIQQSLSPAMHNGGFDALLLPHEYGPKESDDVSTYQAVLSSTDFGGGSVTIPHKETIIPFLDEVRGAAEDIGAINTIVVEGHEGQGGRRLVAYNTDWLGMKRPILRQLQRKGAASWKARGSYGLVAGAGGTARAACYAMRDLGLEVLVYNRSPEKGKELAHKFGGRYVSEAELADPAFMEGWGRLQVVISTIPGQAAFTLPAGVLEGNQPVVLDAVYKPARTALLQQALGAGCYVVQGASMLLEQGLEQFELWNRRRAPREEMKEAVFEGVELVEI